MTTTDKKLDHISRQLQALTARSPRTIDENLEGIRQQLDLLLTEPHTGEEIAQVMAETYAMSLRVFGETFEKLGAIFAEYADKLAQKCSSSHEKEPVK